MSINLPKRLDLKLFHFNEVKPFVFIRGRQLGKVRKNNFVTRYMCARFQKSLDENFYTLEYKRFSKILTEVKEF